MFRSTIRDWLMATGVVVMSMVLLAVGQMGVATLEGNACSVAAAFLLLGGLTFIYRRAQAR
jgi:hypothetical protein